MAHITLAVCGKERKHQPQQVNRAPDASNGAADRKRQKQLKEWKHE